MDGLSPEKRSWNMSRIRGKDTGIEVMVRKYLFSQGYRFRKNDKRYPGKPDILLPKYKTAVFINGCFWHMHEGCKLSVIPKTNTQYWVTKLERNVVNDRKHVKELRETGWNVIILWECELEKEFDSVMNRLTTALNEYRQG